MKPVMSKSSMNIKQENMGQLKECLKGIEIPVKKATLGSGRSRVSR